jgi:energy-coupling factor transporter ATP-binding protein EcfA2
MRWYLPGLLCFTIWAHPPCRLPVPRPGQVLGLVGTNGIGKSTALKILAGKLKPNLGRYGEVSRAAHAALPAPATRVPLHCATNSLDLGGSCAPYAALWSFRALDVLLSVVLIVYETVTSCSSICHSQHCAFCRRRAGGGGCDFAGCLNPLRTLNPKPLAKATIAHNESFDMQWRSGLRGRHGLRQARGVKRSSFAKEAIMRITPV